MLSTQKLYQDTQFQHTFRVGDKPSVSKERFDPYQTHLLLLKNYVVSYKYCQIVTRSKCSN